MTGEEAASSSSALTKDIENAAFAAPENETSETHRGYYSLLYFEIFFFTTEAPARTKVFLFFFYRVGG